MQSEKLESKIGSGVIILNIKFIDKKIPLFPKGVAVLADGVFQLGSN